MNGNYVMIPRFVTEKVGNLDPNFVHSTGDIDYGLRGRNQGGAVWLAPVYAGECSTHPIEEDIWGSPNLTLAERLKKIRQPKGLPLEYKRADYDE